MGVSFDDVCYYLINSDLKLSARYMHTISSHCDTRQLTRPHSWSH